MSRYAALAVSAVLLAASAAGCGASPSSQPNPAATAATPAAPEVNPAGDIPDTQAYVLYRAPSGGFSVSVPEGWSRTSADGAVTFTDKLNAVRIETHPARVPLTARAARQTELPKLAASVDGFGSARVTTVTRKAGPAVRVTYLAAAAPNSVTGRSGIDAVERYVFFHKRQDVVLTLSGPKGADNIDPWRTVTDSVRWTP